jgi:microsomal dipeptidase-like Zn-dependent dipeptidase
VPPRWAGRLWLLSSRSRASWASGPGEAVVGGCLGPEGALALEGRAETVDALADAGFRMMGLTHFFDNEVAGSAHGAR